MANRQTDMYGNPAHHTGHLGAPGTTGAFETHDPLGAPGTTGASPTTGAGAQDQLHRPLNPNDYYAYGTAATTDVPQHTTTTSLHKTQARGTPIVGLHTAPYDKDTKHVSSGYDTGSAGKDTKHASSGGYDTKHEEGRHGSSGYDAKDTKHGSEYETGGKKDTRHGSDYDTGSGGVAHRSGGGDWTHTQTKEHGVGGGDVFGSDRYESLTGGGGGGGECVSATVVEVVTEDPSLALRDEDTKGFIDRIMEHLPGTGGGGGTTK